MTTRCSFCGRTLDEDTEDNFVICRHCNKFTPKGANSYNKEEVKMDKVKKEKTGIIIKQLIEEGKTNEEILNQVSCKLGYVKMVRYKLKKNISI